MNWRKFEHNPVNVEEGQQYLFALRLSNGAWEYFVDALVWDSETEPHWREACSGWDEDAPEYFCELESPQ